MAIRLHISRMRVVQVVEDEINKLVIEMADTRRVVRWQACGYKTSKVHETRRVEIRDLPLGRPAPLVWLQRRFQCPNVGIDNRGPPRDRG
jgi:zinc-finger of transposase IS204/IS1001/IS1096/IS1165